MVIRGSPSFQPNHHNLPSCYLTVCHGKSPFLIGKPSISMGHLYHGYVRIRGYHPSLRSSGTISPDTSSARWTAKWRSTGASATSEFGAAHVRTTRRMPMRWSLGGADGGWRCFYHFLQFFTIFYHFLPCLTIKNMEGLGAEHIQKSEGLNWSKAWSIVVQWTGFVGKI